MKRLIVATHNAHKTEEIREILRDCFDEVSDLTGTEIPPAVEDGDTFEANARIKALHASRQLSGVTVLADDSGLEVDALAGAPGVFSARYAGEEANDSDNRAKLLQELGDSKDRAARFRCVLVLAQDEEIVHVCSGAVEGQIIHENRGDNGFGYDPLFVPDGHEQTFGELPAETKNGISHRANALKALKATLSKSSL